jgi:hypothetical protein
MPPGSLRGAKPLFSVEGGGRKKILIISKRNHKLTSEVGTANIRV